MTADPRTALAAAPSDGAGPGRASLWRRLGALVYEVLLLTALALVAGFLLLPLTTPTRAAAPTIPPLFVRTMIFCALVGGMALFYRWFWSGGRRTLPQKTWRLRLVDGRGAPPTRATALVRYVAGWIGPSVALATYAAMRPYGTARYAVLLLFANYAWALVDRDRRFLHDRIAGTRIVDDPPRERATR